MKNLYQYAVLIHKYEEKDNKKVYVDSELIIEPKTVLAKSEKDLIFKVTREIPEEYAIDPDNVQILVRNF
jgi:hypothetical protein